MPWIQLFIAVLAYLSAKKSGASSTQAAFLGLGAGLATNYVVKDTEWGRETLGPLNDTVNGWFGLESGTVNEGAVTDGNGNPVAIPKGTTPVTQPDGSIVFVPNKDAANSSPWHESVADVLTGWGATGTATVVGTTALATSSNKIYLFLGLGLLAAVLIS